MDTGVFSADLANYTELAAYNDADITVNLKDLPEGTTAQLKKSGQVVADFVDGTASPTGKAVSKIGEYDFVIALESGEQTVEYQLHLKKATSLKWSVMKFEGIPAFSDTEYYGKPEGTLFQLDDNGSQTGKTGLSDDCFHYAVYVSPTVESIKPEGNSGINILKNFKYNNKAATAYLNNQIIIEKKSTCLAMAMAWAELSNGAQLGGGSTELRFKFDISETEVVNTTITFVKAKSTPTELIEELEKLEVEKLVYPDDKYYIESLQISYDSYTEEEKKSISAELIKKLEQAYEILREDRVPNKLEIVKSASKLTYTAGQTFDPTGT